MTRLAALLLPLLVACNSGPLQWADAEQWSGTSRVTACLGLPAGLCSMLTRRIEVAAFLSRSVPDLAVATCFTRLNVTTGAFAPGNTGPRQCRVVTDPALSRVIYTGDMVFRSGESRFGAVSIEARTTWTINASWFDDTANMPRDAVGSIDVVTTLAPVP